MCDFQKIPIPAILCFTHSPPPPPKLPTHTQRIRESWELFKQCYKKVYQVTVIKSNSMTKKLSGLGKGGGGMFSTKILLWGRYSCMDCFLEHAKPTDNINYDFCFSQIIWFPQTTKILGDNEEVTLCTCSNT